MSWRTEWNAISAQIQSLVDSGKLYVEAAAPKGRSDYHKIAAKRIISQAQRAYESIKKFAEKYKTIPLPAHTCLEEFIRNFDAFLHSELASHGDASHETLLRLSLLASLQSELAYYLSDFSAIAKRLSERAFLHLQRSIVADQSIKKQWNAAFDASQTAEIACEKLGGAHLLLHGIWGFKASSAGGCTDLVFREPIDITEVEIAAEALVLTEWKIVRERSERESKAEEARRQAADYAGGLLDLLYLST
jgi:hypothetical protein